MQWGFYGQFTSGARFLLISKYKISFPNSYIFQCGCGKNLQALRFGDYILVTWQIKLSDWLDFKETIVLTQKRSKQYPTESLENAFYVSQTR